MDPLPLMTAVLECLGRELASAPGGKPGWMALVPGRTVVADWCTPGCDGMGFVRLDAAWRSTAFPQVDNTPQACMAPWAIRLELGVLRCLPAAAPSVQESEATTAIQVADFAAIIRTLGCCAELKRNIPGTYTPLGPLGACGGGSMTVTTQVMR